MVIPPVYNVSSLCGTGFMHSVYALDSCILNQTQMYLRWIEQDERIVGLDGFHFGTYGKYDVGLQDLPRSKDCYARLGDQLTRQQPSIYNS